MLGTKFSPTGDDMQQRPQGSLGGSPVQEAVRTLSLRVPRWTGGNTAPAPQALLQSPGMAGVGSQNPIMQALMQILKGGFGGFGGGSSPTKMSMLPYIPPPKVEVL